jgi:hypothetical protein
VGWFDRHFSIIFGILAFGMAALLAKQGIAIAEYGVTGRLEGEGPFQTEWEVRAVAVLLFTLLPAMVVVALVRSGEAVLARVREWRLIRAVRRSRRRG